MYLDVDVPTKYGLVYDDLALRTPDGVELRSYLLMQRKEISHTHAMHVDWDENQSNEDVSPSDLLYTVSLIWASLRPRGLPSSCFTATAEIMATGYLWLGYSLSRCAATCSCCLIGGMLCVVM